MKDAEALSSSGIESARTRCLFARSRYDIVIAIGTAAALELGLWSVVPAWKLLLWQGLFLPVQLLRYVLLSSCERSRPSDKVVSHWRKRILLGSTVTACLWGMGGVFLFPSESVFHQGVLGLILVGATGSASFAHAPLTAFYLAPACLTLVPFLLRLVRDGGPTAWIMAAAGFMLLAAIIATAKAFHTLIVRTITLESSVAQLTECRNASSARTDQTCNANISLAGEGEGLREEIAQIERTEESFHVIADHAPFGLVIVAEDGKFQYSNPMFRRMFGYGPNDVPNGKTWLRKAYPDPLYRRDVIRCWIEDMEAAEPGQYRPRTFVVTCKDGTKKTIHFTAVQLDKGRHLLACVDVTDTQRLQEERDRLFNLSLDMLCVAGFDGFFRQVNPAWTKILGWESEELLKKPWIDLVHPDDRGAAMEIIRTVLEGQPLLSHENRYMCKDGTYRWISWNAFPLPGEKLIFAVARDVTQRRHAEEELKENQRRLRAVLEHLPHLLWMKDRNGVFLMVNEVFARSCGRASIEEVIGKTDFDVWPKALAELYTADDASVMASEKAKWTEEPIVDRGETKWFETFKTPLFDSDGTLVGTVGSARDITARKSAEEALRQSEEKHRRILETIADGYHEVDLKGTLTLVNDSLCEILGYSREELLQVTFRRFMDEETARRVFLAYNEVYRTGIPNRSISFEVTRKDGAKREVSAGISLIRDSDGAPTGFRGILRDITERRHLEEQLRQAVKMEAIGRLAGGVAHDFNNLLTAIMGYTSILSLRLKGDEDSQSRLRQIARAAERAADLTRQLLAFSRKQVLEVRVLNLNSLVKDIESMLSRLIGEDVELATDLDPSIGNVRADATQIEQIIVNLAVNARDAMPNGGTLTIETKNAVLDEGYCSSRAEVVPGEYVVLCVSDTGHGMDDETCKRAFDPFFTTKAKGGGTGLGLSTVYGIVKQHGGHVALYSEPGSGTTFKVYLPQVTESAGISDTTSDDKEKLMGTETILLVEDEQVVRDLASEALQLLGYSVLTASSPSEALAIASDHASRIHLLLTDVVLPQMDGKTLYETLVLDRPGMKVLYVSGYTENFIVHRGILDFGVTFLQKPFSIENLSRKVRELLDSGP
ncbi:MAG: PAS domain S-box protein [Thermodesulfobacteriota bacterium]